MTDATNMTPDQDQAATPQRLALKPAEAAEALGIGRHKLWELTNRGILPHVRFGRAVRYPIDGLRHFLAEEARRSLRR